MKKEKTLGELSQEFPDKTYKELERYRNEDRQEEAGICILGEMKKDREQNPRDKIKELEEALANALAINESHQKLNGKLHSCFPSTFNFFIQVIVHLLILFL